MLGGENTTIKTTNRGLIVTGRQSKFESGSNYGNLIIGDNSKIEPINNFGNIIAGYNLTFDTSDRTHNQKGNLISGSNVTFTGSGFITGNNLLGTNATLQCNTVTGNILASNNLVINSYSFYANVISDINFKFGDKVDKVFRTLIVGGFSDDSKPLSSIKNYGLIFDSSNQNNATSPSNNPNYRYKIHYPNIQNAAALLDGYKQYSENMSIMDKDDEYIIKDGKLNVDHPSIIAKINELIDARLAQL